MNNIPFRKYALNVEVSFASTGNTTRIVLVVLMELLSVSQKQANGVLLACAIFKKQSKSWHCALWGAQKGLLCYPTSLNLVRRLCLDAKSSASSPLLGTHQRWDRTQREQPEAWGSMSIPHGQLEVQTRPVSVPLH